MRAKRPGTGSGLTKAAAATADPALRDGTRAFDPSALQQTGLLHYNTPRNDAGDRLDHAPDIVRGTRLAIELGHDNLEQLIGEVGDAVGDRSSVARPAP